MTATAVAEPEAEGAATPAPRRGRARTGRGAALLLALLVGLCAYAAFAHGAIALADEAWLQAGIGALALAGAAALAAGALSIRTSRAGWVAVLALAAFAAWCGVSLLWSITPDATWQETNRAIAYTLLVALALAAGTRAPRAVERTAQGLLLVAVAVALDALLGKVLPGVTDGTALSPRLREPLGYWNALALVCVLGAPAAIRFATGAARPARWRLAALAALWLLVVVAGLTYSRGAILALAAALVVLTVLGEARLRGLAVLAMAAVAALPGLAYAFTTPALSDPGAALGSRISAGRDLLAILVACLVALIAGGVAALRAEERVVWPAARTRAVWRALAVVAAVGAAAIVLSGAAADMARQFADTQQGPSVSDPSRLLSANSGNRLVWWDEALGAWRDAPVAGHGAGSFPALHLQYRDNDLNVRQPHDVPLEFLAETGVIGGVLGIGGVVALLAAAGAAARRRGELAVALFAAGVAWAVHALVDWDWDIPAVTAMALLALGVVAARPQAGGAAPRRPSVVALVAAALAGWVYLVSIALPALSDARAGAALHVVQPGASDAALEDAAARAAFAARLDPLAVRPLFAGAAIADRRGRVLEERRLLLDAVHRQPSSAQGWLRLADVALGLGDAKGVAAATDRALELDPRNGRARDAAEAAPALDAPPSASPAATGTPLP